MGLSDVLQGLGRNSKSVGHQNHDHSCRYTAAADLPYLRHFGRHSLVDSEVVAEGILEGDILLAYPLEVDRSSRMVAHLAGPFQVS